MKIRKGEDVRKIIKIVIMALLTVTFAPMMVSAQEVTVGPYDGTYGMLQGTSVDENGQRYYQVIIVEGDRIWGLSNNYLPWADGVAFTVVNLSEPDPLGAVTLYIVRTDGKRASYVYNPHDKSMSGFPLLDPDEFWESVGTKSELPE
jgi:hypothetical protein